MVSLGRWLLLAAMLGLMAPTPMLAQRGAITQPRNLAELVAQSHLIFRGRVISAQLEPHPDLRNLPTVLVKVAAEEVWKGDAGKTFTFRQFVWDARDRQERLGYRKGQAVVLMMNRPTQLGLSSPAGLEQGRFLVLRQIDGREAAVNGQANAGLFRGLAPQLEQKRVPVPGRYSALLVKESPGPLRLEDLRGLVQFLAGVP